MATCEARGDYEGVWDYGTVRATPFEEILVLLGRGGRRERRCRHSLFGEVMEW